MRALVWITENTWEPAIDHARALLPDAAEITLLHVSPSDVQDLATEGVRGLLGRNPMRPAGPPLRVIAAEEAQVLLKQALGRLQRQARLESRRGRVEREVVAACSDLGAELLVLAREGQAQLGPPSLGRQVRFVVDHAPCQVLLVWAFAPPGLETIPPPPPEPPPPE